MIAFGSAMSDPEAYRRFARPGIERAAEPDSEIFAYAATGSVCRSYNLVLDRVAAREDLEALVVVQQNVELLDEDLCDKVRAALRDPAVAIVGCAGATGVRGIAWWEGSISAAPSSRRYDEHGGGEMAAFVWTEASPPPAEVESVDGALLVLSPWVVRNLRFDERLLYGHGFDFDLCQQARAAGYAVRTADMRVVYHQALELVKERALDVWIESHLQIGRKWDGRLPGSNEETPDWKRRARLAEAQRDAARTIAYSSRHDLDARLQPLERAVDELTATLSWRLTTPLRRLNLARRRLAGRD